MSTTNIPGVGELTSTALTVDQLNVIWQALVQQMLGIDPLTDPLADARVRIDFPPDGQPGWAITDDVAFLQAEEVPGSYNQQHEFQPDPNGEESYTQTAIYTRIIEVSFDFWGPNSFDRARQVKSCFYQQFVHDTLAASNLYLISDFATPRRAPEKFASQWWERVHFSVKMNEQVTETLVLPTMGSVEVVTRTADGIVSDIVVEF